MNICTTCYVGLGKCRENKMDTMYLIEHLFDFFSFLKDSLKICVTLYLIKW